MRKLRAGILGATGTVGQRLIQLLERHPWFEVSVVAASDNSAGKNYAQATRWMLETPIPEAVAKMTVQACQPGLDCDFAIRAFTSPIDELKLPSAPKPVMYLESHVQRPQPQLDRDRGQGMAVVVGPVSACPVLDYKFRLLSHNTIRGAAGAAVLNAKLLYRKGLIG